MTPLNDVTARDDPQEAWFWWICEKARESSNLRGLSVEHAVAISYELAALHITPDPVDAPETLPRRVRVVKSSGPKFWYAKCIGDEFEVTGAVRLKENAGFPGYWVINPSEPERIEHYVIDIDDCVPVTEAVSNVPPCYDGGACRNADALHALQHELTQANDRLKLADDLVREFVHRNSPMTPQQREAWEKWTGKGAG